MNNNLIKTDDWLSVKDLHSIFVGGLQYIYMILEKNVSKYPDMISYRLVPGCKKRQVLCLKKSFVQEFANISGLELRDNKSEFLSVRQIQKYVYGGHNKIYNLLKKYSQQYPNHIKLKNTGGNRQAVYLNKKYLDKFISLSCLIPYNNDFVKTDKWLSVAELERTIVGHHKTILAMLKEKQIIMPYAIQYKKIGSNIALCLDKNYLSDFMKDTNFVLRTDLASERKTSDWLNTIELKEFVLEEKKKLRQKLRDLQDVMPYAIQTKFHKAQFCICLHKNYIDEFLQKTGFKRAGPEITSQKTIAWLSATDIQKYVVATQSQIQELLVKYTKLKGREFIAYKKAEGKKQPILCLNKKYLKNFVNTYDLKWKRDVLRAGMIKLQTINPNKQFDTIFIHAKKTNGSSK
ncbi:MAG: hypothetical protein MJ158_01060 [Alphaproteobacteria bacterium]|nr:hypothetical protein [Alphaproteobacteria bacterium]